MSFEPSKRSILIETYNTLLEKSNFWTKNEDFDKTL